ERSARGPPAVAHSSGCCDIGECAVAVVLEQVVPAEASDVQIVKAIIIIVTYRGAHSPTDVSQSGLVSDISKCPIAVVVIEGALCFSSGLPHVDREAIYQIDILITVVVVVEEGQAAAHGFHKISLLGRADM